MSKHATREAWLLAAAAELAQLLGKAGHPVATRYRVSCGWPSKGATSAHKRRLGECWAVSASDGKLSEVFVSPLLAHPVGKARDGVLPTLLHELVHVAVGTEAGHRGAFRRAATAAGLEGKMTATVASAGLAERLNALSRDLGPYPHDKLTPKERGKVGSRLLLAMCGCGIKVRLSRQAADSVTAAWTCGVCGGPIMLEGEEDDDDG